MRIKKLKFSGGCVEKKQDGEFIAKGGFEFNIANPRTKERKEIQTKPGQGCPN
jgi:hypothetical protein